MLHLRRGGEERRAIGLKRLFGFGTLIGAVIAALILFLVGPPIVCADGPPELPVVARLLNGWKFDDTNLLSVYNDYPMGGTNLFLVPSWDGTALYLHPTNAAWLRLNTIEADGWTNLYCGQGTISMWFAPNWQSGGGPGVWGRLFEVGAWSSDASNGWWSLYFDAGGTNIFFSAQEDGVSTNYLWAPISWESNAWRFIALSYSPSNSSLYLDGQLAASGPGVSLKPGQGVFTNGFLLGSDETGTAKAHGMFEHVRIWDLPIGAAAISNHYLGMISRVWPLPLLSGPGDFGGGASLNDIPNPPGEFEGGGEGSSNTNFPAPYQHGTNELWLEILPLGTNQFNTDTNSATLLLHNTEATIVYLIESKQSLSLTNWSLEQAIVGPETTNLAATTVSMIGRSNLFFRAIAYTLDSEGQGLPDWWRIQYFGTNSVDPYADPDGDGWTNIEEFGNGTSPYQFDAPPPAKGLSVSLDATGTNAIITWLPAGGPVAYYTVEHFDGSVIGTVASNITTFLDSQEYTTGTGFRTHAEYYIKAHYSNGFTALSVPITGASTRLNRAVAVVRGANSAPYFVLNSPPPDLDRVEMQTSDFLNPSQTIMVHATNFLNGIAPIPTNTFGPSSYYYIEARIFSTNGSFSQVLPVSTYYSEDLNASSEFEFVDARRQSKENLKFLLRAATLTRQFGYTSGYDVNSSGEEAPVFAENIFEAGSYLARFTNTFGYEYYGTRVYDAYWDALIGSDTRPLKENAVWRNFIFEQGQNSLGNSTLGANYDSDEGLRFISEAVYFYTNVSRPYPATLYLTNVAGSALYYRWFASQSGYNLTEAADIGVGLDGSNRLYLQNNVVNYFGLALNSLIVGDGNEVLPGSLVPSNTSPYYANFAIPNLSTVGYYFASQSHYLSEFRSYPTWASPRPPLPGTPDFSVTNTSPLTITCVGEPITLIGWAKQSIVNGYTNKFAYLEQYFDKAYTVTTNGTVTTNETGILSPHGEFFPMEPGPAALVTMPDIDTGERGTGIVHVISLNVDANHDGVMDFSYGGPDSVSPAKPFRFWVNDDDDFAETVGTDISDLRSYQNNGSANWQGKAGTLQVDGVRDLVDFFPVYLSIRSLLQALPPSSSVRYILKHADGAVNMVYAPLTAENFRNYLKETNTARSLGNADAFWVNASGHTLKQDFLNGIVNSNLGIILVEGRKPTTQPLVLEVWQSTNLMARTTIPMRLSRVEEMFRQKNLIRSIGANSLVGFPDRLGDADVPNEPETHEKSFVFLHGYNVNPNQARGWFSEMFKRLFWSGSQARFYGVTWLGSQTQKGGKLTPNYHTNVVNALLEAPKLRDFLDTLTNGTVTVAAHSLGNMVVLGALSDWNSNIDSYFMIDAAVALEAIDGSTPISTNMVHPEWSEYQMRLWASYWYTLFPTNDFRNQLSWSNRLSNLRNANVYNFYSSGEEVLRTHMGHPPTITAEIFNQGVMNGILGVEPAGNYAWALQEKLKGRTPGDWILGSSYGGWGFNIDYVDGQTVERMPPSVAAQLPDAQLKTNAFFKVTSLAGLMDSATGSNFAQTNQFRLLADIVPALTVAIGANPVERLALPNQPDRNYNMQLEFKNGWPMTRTNNEGQNWHHSDVREVAYTFVYKLVDTMVELGGLE